MSCCDFDVASPAQSRLGHAVYKLTLTTYSFPILTLAHFLCWTALCWLSDVAVRLAAWCALRCAGMAVNEAGRHTHILSTCQDHRVWLMQT